jgi:hypothetical protein
VDELPLRVQRLQDPQRIVLDIASTPVGAVADRVRPLTVASRDEA